MVKDKTKAIQIFVGTFLGWEPRTVPGLLMCLFYVYTNVFVNSNVQWIATIPSMFLVTFCVLPFANIILPTRMTQYMYLHGINFIKEQPIADSNRSLERRSLVCSPELIIRNVSLPAFQGHATHTKFQVIFSGIVDLFN